MKKLLIFFLFNISINASAQLFLTECDVINDVMDYVVYLSRGCDESYPLYFSVYTHNDSKSYDESYNDCFKTKENMYLWNNHYQLQEDGDIINIFISKKRKRILYNVVMGWYSHNNKIIRISNGCHLIYKKKKGYWTLTRINRWGI